MVGEGYLRSNIYRKEMKPVCNIIKSVWLRTFSKSILSHIDAEQDSRNSRICHRTKPILPAVSQKLCLFQYVQCELSLNGGASIQSSTFKHAHQRQWYARCNCMRKSAPVRVRGTSSSPVSASSSMRTANMTSWLLKILLTKFYYNLRKSLSDICSSGSTSNQSGIRQLRYGGYIAYCLYRYNYSTRDGKIFYHWPRLL